MIDFFLKFINIYKVLKYALKFFEFELYETYLCQILMNIFLRNMQMHEFLNPDTFCQLFISIINKYCNI